MQGDRAIGLEFKGQSLALKPDDSVIVAVPPWAARDLVAGIDTPDKFNGIVNAHFRISAPQGQPTILGVIGGLTQWLFAYRGEVVRYNQRRGRFDRLESRALGADDLEGGFDIDGARGRRCRHIRIVKEKRATFAATPEQDAKRPSARTSWSNVFLAGDWVQTGLPATIEGAVRSGYEAARLIAAARPGASLVTRTAFA